MAVSVLPITEAELLETIRQAAHLFGWRTYHTRYAWGSDAGFPDLVLLRGPVQLVAELKSAKGTLTEAQQAWLEAFRAAGVPAYVWRPADIDAAIDVLRNKP